MESQFGGGGGTEGRGRGWLSRDERPTVMSPRFAHPRDLLKRTHFVRLHFHRGGGFFCPAAQTK